MAAVMDKVISASFFFCSFASRWIWNGVWFVLTVATHCFQKWLTLKTQGVSFNFKLGGRCFCEHGAGGWATKPHCVGQILFIQRVNPTLCVNNGVQLAASPDREGQAKAGSVLCVLILVCAGQGLCPAALWCAQAAQFWSQVLDLCACNMMQVEHGYWGLQGEHSICLLLAQNISDSTFWSGAESTGSSPYPSNGWQIQADVYFFFICQLMFQNGHKRVKSLPCVVLG